MTVLALEERAYELGFDVLVAQTLDIPEREEGCVRRFLARLLGSIQGRANYDDGADIPGRSLDCGGGLFTQFRHQPLDTRVGGIDADGDHVLAIAFLCEDGASNKQQCKGGSPTEYHVRLRSP